MEMTVILAPLPCAAKHPYGDLLGTGTRFMSRGGPLMGCGVHSVVQETSPPPINGAGYRGLPCDEMVTLALT